MTENYKHIEDMIHRFDQGTITNAQERELFDFFNGDDVPVHLLPEKAFFQYMGDGFIRELGKTESVLPMQAKSLKRRYIVIPLSAAAAVVLFLLAQPILNSPGFDPYAGSYIVRNGKRIHDLEQIKQEERIILEMSRAKNNEIRQIFESSELKIKEYTEILNVNN